jgi:uncharacterized protein
VLTADLVHVRRRGDLLFVVPLGPDERERALALASTTLELASAHVGQTRGRLLEALRALPVSARERRLADGVTKLVLDGCRFEETTTLDPAALRADLFARATALRRGLAPRALFDREAVVAELAAERKVTTEEVEQALYADLPDAHILRTVEVPGPRVLVASYETAQIQAVLLRAVRVRVQLQKTTPADCRRLFGKLKFLQLLHRILPQPAAAESEPGGYVIHIDGPFSLFESVTKYGLQLALAYPAIAACGAFTLEAEVRWGKDRRPLRFLTRGEPAAVAQDPPADARQTRRQAEPPLGGVHPPLGEAPDPPLPEEIARLLADLRALQSPWRIEPAQRLIDLPGLGLCIPDLELTHQETGRTVCVEVLGFWSRDAVWKRIELAARGLPVPLVFAVSKHLRVSEAALPDHLPAALYVYAKVPSARALLERVEAVTRRGGPDLQGSAK